jgi:hypothetical protein
METKNIFFKGDVLSLIARSGGREKTFRGLAVTLEPLGLELQDALGETDLQTLNSAEELIVADTRRGYAFSARMAGMDSGIARLSLLGRHELRDHFRVETMIEFGYDVLRRAARGLPTDKKEREDRIDSFLAKAQESEQKDNPLVGMMLYMYEEIRELRQKVYAMSSESAVDTRTPKQYMADISGSGLRFVTDTEHNKGDVLRFIISLPNATRPVSAVGKVLRSDMEMGRKGMSSVACEFTDIQESDREAIIQFVFQAQRQKLKRSSNALPV